MTPLDLDALALIKASLDWSSGGGAEQEPFEKKFPGIALGNASGHTFSIRSVFTSNNIEQRRVYVGQWNLQYACAVFETNGFKEELTLALTEMRFAK